MPVEFTVQAVPVAQPRQRHTVIAGRPHNYTPQNDPVNSFKATVRLALQDVYSGPPLDGPLRLRLDFIMPRPKNMIWKKREMPREWHAKRPDADNLAKSVKDALQGLLWRDDSQIAELVAVKRVAAGWESPHVVIIVDQLIR